MRKTLAMMVLTWMITVTVTGCQQSQPTDFSTVTTIEPKAVAQLLEEQGVKLYPVKVTDNSIDLLSKRPLVYYTEGRNNYLLIYDLDNPLKRDEARNDFMRFRYGDFVKTFLNNYHLKAEEATEPYQMENYMGFSSYPAKNLLILVSSRTDRDSGYQLIDSTLNQQLVEWVKDDIMGVQQFQQIKETAHFKVTMTLEEGGYWWREEGSSGFGYDQRLCYQVVWADKGFLQLLPLDTPIDLTVKRARGSLAHSLEWQGEDQTELVVQSYDIGLTSYPSNGEYTAIIAVGDQVETVDFEFDLDNQYPEEWR